MKRRCFETNTVFIMAGTLLLVFLFMTACPPGPDPEPEGDSYEPDNSYSAANTLSTGVPQDHTLLPSNDYDYMKFTGISGYLYTVATFSEVDLTDTILYLYDTNGTTLLAYNDDNSDKDMQPIRTDKKLYKDINRSFQSTIVWSCPADGTYYLMVKGYSGATGNYSILLTETAGTPTPEPTETPAPTATPEPTETPASGEANWTIMVYLDADNNLEPYGIDDFNEMEGVDLSGSGVNVIVLMDRISGYDTSNGDWTGTRLYEVTYDSLGPINDTIVSTELASTELGLTTGGSEEELNMGDPAVCMDFIDFCKASYPATHYFMIFWNHGSGWKSAVEPGNKELTYTLPLTPMTQPARNRGVCFDDTSGDHLYTEEIGTALAGQGISVVGFDACFEQMIEVVYEIKEDAAYVIGSEETEPGDGWEYDIVLNNILSSGQRPLEIVNAAVDAYASRYSTTTGATLSGIDCSRVDELMAALNDFSDTLAAAITNDQIRDKMISIFLNNIESFYSVATGYGDYNIDIGDMADVILWTYDYADAQALALQTAMENAVVAEWHHTATGYYGNPRAHGLAIYFASLNNFSVVGHEYAYMHNYSWLYPLAFVADTTWNMYYSGGNVVGPGLLYSLFYQSF
ncbi:MAG: hypothetical protein JXJ04_15045 [Spirochaetales bacterium]|nr:hypothetical protein [Spirochaetales bacterium]